MKRIEQEISMKKNNKKEKGKTIYISIRETYRKEQERKRYNKTSLNKR